MNRLFTFLLVLVLVLTSIPLAGAEADAEITVLDILIYFVEHYETAPDKFMDASDSLVPNADISNDIVEIAFWADSQIIVVAGKNLEGKFCAYMYGYDESFPFELCNVVAITYPVLMEYAREGEEIRISWRLPDGTDGSARNAEAAAALAEVFEKVLADK